MKIIIIVSIILIIVLSYIIRIHIRIAKMNKTRDALSLLSRHGWYGFIIGDTYEFVISRIKHLHLMSEEELEAQKGLNELMGGYIMRLYIGEGRYDRVERISFSFSNNLLSMIQILVYDKN